MISEVNDLATQADGKLCKTCKLIKPIAAFALRSDTHYYRGSCTPCRNAKHNPVRKAWRHSLSPEKKLAEKEDCRQWKIKNRERWNKIVRDYRANNPKRMAALDRKYQKRKKQDPHYRMVMNLRRRLCLAVNKAGAKKSDHSLALVGCTAKELRAHLESLFTPGMSWDNYGKKGWHVDHKLACATFDLTKPEQQRRCFHFSNLQPLWWQENLSKGARSLAR